MLTPSHQLPSHQGLGIGVGPVILADYLVERPYLIFQSSTHRLEMSDQHEWAGSLSDDIARTVGSNIGHQLGTGNIHRYPWDRETEVDYKISIDVHRFHGDTHGDAILDATWRIYRMPESNIISSRSVSLKEPLNADGFDELVAAQSRLLNTLAQKISQNIR